MLVLLIAFALWAIEDLKKAERETTAICDIWCPWHKRIFQMRTNPSTRRADWQAIIPALEIADQTVARDVYSAKFQSLTELAMRELRYLSRGKSKK